MSYTKESILKKLNEDKRFEYIIDEYKGVKSKIKFKCKKCNNIFERTPDNHFNKKSGCPYCNNFIKINSDIFIKKAKQIHGEKYDYSLSKCNKNSDKVKIKCNTCNNIFEQKVANHLNKKYGCPYCSGRKKYTTEEWINKAKQIHGEKYDYNLTEYKNANIKVKIKCNVCNNIFEQRAAHHLRGIGCPNCSSSKGEESIAKYLDDKGFVLGKTYFRQYKFNDLRSGKGKNDALKFDFYIPKQNLLIEFQGIQHYKAVKRFGREDGFKERQKYDKMKREYCLKNNINEVEIKYNENIDKVLEVIING